MTEEAEPGRIYVDTQHEDLVHDAQLDYYGCRLATCSSGKSLRLSECHGSNFVTKFILDRTIKIYNVSETSYELSATLQGHEGPVWQVSWSHPKFGVLLASCSFDGSVFIHREIRPRDWSLVHVARRIHDSSVNSVAFAPHEYGLKVASASSDGRVSIISCKHDDDWSLEYIEDNALGVNSVSWAPSGAYCDESNPEAAEIPRLVTGGCDNRIRFWKLQESGQWCEDIQSPLSKDLCHSDWVRDVAWAPSLVPNVNVVASCSEDRTVLIWTQNGQNEEWKAILLHTFDSPVWRVSWSVTGHMLAVSSGDNDVSIWKAGVDGTWSQMSTVEDSGETSHGG